MGVMYPGAFVRVIRKEVRTSFNAGSGKLPFISYAQHFCKQVVKEVNGIGIFKYHIGVSFGNILLIRMVFIKSVKCIKFNIWVIPRKVTYIQHKKSQLVGHSIKEGE